MSSEVFCVESLYYRGVLWKIFILNLNFFLQGGKPDLAQITVKYILSLVKILHYHFLKDHMQSIYKSYNGEASDFTVLSPSSQIRFSPYFACLFNGYIRKKK